MDVYRKWGTNRMDLRVAKEQGNSRRYKMQVIIESSQAGARFPGALRFFS